MFVITSIILFIVLIGAILELEKKKGEIKLLNSQNEKLSNCVLENKDVKLLPEKSEVDILIDKIENSKVRNLDMSYYWDIIRFKNDIDLRRLRTDHNKFGLFHKGIYVKLSQKQVDRIAEIFNRKLVE